MGTHARLPAEAGSRLTVTPQRILLVGGSGFMGRHASRALATAGHHVTVLARHAQPGDGVAFVTCDRSDTAALARALEGLHFDLTVDFLAWDAADVERLLKVPHAALGRYVMISTGQVYLIARGSEPPYREDAADADLIDAPAEGSRDRAGWDYGVGKRRAEKVLLALRGTHGVRAMALRLPIVQGAGDGSLRLWAWIERMLDGGPILVPDAGTRLTRHLWAGDVARATAWLAEHDAPRQAFYNLAQPETLPLRELLDRIAHAAGLTPTFVDVSWEELRAAGFDEDMAPYSGRWASRLDPTRAAEEWGFATTRVGEYLPQVVRWHLEHRPSASHAGYASRAREREFARGART